MSRGPASRWWPLATGLIVIVGVLTIYLPSLHFDFHTDDFVSLRPWPARTLWRSLTGTWHDFPGAPGFYRPVAVLYYALAFTVFGVNTAPLHVLPLLVVAVSGALVGVFVWRETSSRTGAALGALLYVIHPGTSTSVGPWIANQYQGFATILALVALLIWQRCRTRPLMAWAPLIVALVLAGFTKEDALMLPLVLVAGQWVIARWTRTVAPPSRPIVVAALGLFAAMNAWRWLMLGAVGGYPTPEPAELLLNLLRGPYFTLVVQLGAPLWAIVATGASIICVLAALAGVLRDRTAAETRVALMGLTLLALADLPLALMTSIARSYLLTLGAVLTITSGAMTLQRSEWLARRGVVAAAGLAAVVISFVVVSREQIEAFAPCSWESRVGYEWVRDERLPYIAPEFGPWLDAHILSCDSATYRPLIEALPVLTWPLDDGNTVLLVTEGARSLTLRVRAGAASAASPVNVDIQANSQPVQAISLTTAEWTDVTLPLQASLATSLRRSHRIDVQVRHASGVEVRPGAVRY